MKQHLNKNQFPALGALTDHANRNKKLRPAASKEKQKARSGKTTYHRPRGAASVGSNHPVYYWRTVLRLQKTPENLRKDGDNMHTPALDCFIAAVKRLLGVDTISIDRSGVGGSTRG